MKRIVTALATILLCLTAGNSFGQNGREDAAAGGLSLEVLAICAEVSDRTPLGKASVFSVNVGKLYCFTKVVGAQAETRITHNWFRNGKLRSSVTLPVKSASWRTWSLKKIGPEDAGEWMVEVLNETGEPIESILFIVQ